MIRQIIGLIARQEKLRGLCVVFFTLIIALSEFAGVALIVPLLYLLFDKKSLESNSFLYNAYLHSNIPSISSFVLVVVFLIFILFLAKNILTYRLTIFQNNYLTSLYRHFTIHLFTYYYSKGALFFKNQNSNNLTYHVNYVSYVFVFSILANLIKITSEGLLFLLLSITILFLSPKVYLLLIILFLPALFIYNYIIKSRLSEIGERENVARKTQTRIVHEVFKGYAEMEVNHAFPLLMKNFTSELDTLSDCKISSIKISGQWERLLEMGAISGLLIVLLYNTFFPSQEGIGLFVFALLSISLLRLLPTVRSILGCVSQIKSNLFVWEIVSELYGEKLDVSEKISGNAIRFEDKIEIENLTFGFKTGKDVISNLNLTLRKGEKVAIRGFSGSGKTTFFHLLLGLYPAVNGKIKIDGTELSETNRSSWHKQVGYVSQEVFILDGSLELNVALGIEVGQIDRQRIEVVLQQAGLSQFLKQLPDGLKSRLGDNGSKISGGERQRIGIARALYHNASVLMLDEATSAIDTKTEQEINESLRQLVIDQPDLTILVIAHRGSTMEFCDRIVEMGTN